MKLFVYGTLKRGFGLHTFIRDDWTRIGRATLHNYKMYKSPVGSFPIIMESEDGVVKGELYETDDVDALAVTDYVEGFPELYDRKKVTVYQGKRKHKAYVYYVGQSQLTNHIITPKLIPNGIW